MIVDTALLEREKSGKPIRVGVIGAGAAGRAIALQMATPPQGIRLAAIVNRTRERGERAFREAGVSEWRNVQSAREAEAAIDQGIPILTDDPSVVTSCGAVDLIIEGTGTIEYATRIVLDAFHHGKHVVLVNAELDSFLGPVLNARAKRGGVVITHTDGEEPGVAMTLLRYLRGTGLRTVAAGNLKGMVDHYRNPDTQRGFAQKHDQDPKKVTSFADASKLSMETTVLANATGFRAGRRGMYGPPCEHVREMANLLPADQMLATGLVDYALGAAPYTGAFVIVYEDNKLKQAQMGYVKMGDGPFYTFYTPFHLPHIQIASTIGRAVLHGDATVAPIAGPVCEVISMAKRDMRAGERLDGIGGFCAYGLTENSDTARSINALPLSLSEDCVLRRDLRKDDVISFTDVTLPDRGVVDELWSEQLALWPVAEHAAAK
ncbi:MAG TPA: Gfo/Idh/MocA family oxidoreductase [Terracidiphilus sp.]